jgi:hypothetical protein
LQARDLHLQREEKRALLAVSRRFAVRRHLHLGSTVRWVLLGVVLLIIGARIAAPYVILRVVNDKLADLDGYTGSIDDVDLSLWRGAYQVEGIRIDKSNGKVPVPFLAIERLDLGVEWRALFDGSIVARVVLYRPEVNFVKGPTKAQTQTGKEADWRKELEELVPLRIDSFVIVDGEAHYRDLHARPKVDVVLDHLALTVTNLTNSEEISEDRVAKFELEAILMRSGQLKVEGDIDPFAKQPTFQLKTRLDDLRIAQLNDFLKAYVNVDAERGRLSLYSILRAQKGGFKGYAKPLIENLDLLTWKKEDERPIEKLWEGIVGAAAEVLENQPHDRLATRIPIEGRFDNPDIATWNAVIETLRNAFVRVLQHGLDKPRAA